MLFEKKHSDGDVVTVKLISGDEVIGRFVKEDMAGITLAKPVTIGMTQKGPGMAPVLMTVDPESSLTFNRSSVILMASCYKEIADQYIFQTTGIQPVSAGTMIR